MIEVKPVADTGSLIREKTNRFLPKRANRDEAFNRSTHKNRSGFLIVTDGMADLLMAAAGAPFFLAAAFEINGLDQTHPFEFATTVKQVDANAQ